MAYNWRDEADIEVIPPTDNRLTAAPTRDLAAEMGFVIPNQVAPQEPAAPQPAYNWRTEADVEKLATPTDIKSTMAGMLQDVAGRQDPIRSEATLSMIPQLELTPEQIQAGQGLYESSQGRLVSKYAPDLANTMASQGLDIGGGVAGGLAGMKAGSRFGLPGQFIGGAIGGIIGSTAGKEAGQAANMTPDQSLLSNLGQSTLEEIGGQVMGKTIAAGSRLVKALNPFGEAGSNLAAKQADAILAKRLQDKNLQGLMQGLSTDKNMTIADIGGDSIRALTRTVGKEAGAPRDLINNFLNRRAQGTSQRIVNQLNSKVSNVDKYYQSLDDLTSVRSMFSEPLYRDAYEKGKRLKVPEKYIQDKRVRDAIEEAKKAGMVSLEAPRNSLEALDGAKKILDDKYRSLTRSGETNKGMSYLELKKSLVKDLDGLIPEYKTARDTFAGFSALKDAQEMGLSYATLTPEQIARDISDLSKSELDAYKIGVRSALEKKVFNTAASANEANQIFGKEIQSKQLKTILGDEFEDFSRAMRREIRFNETKQAILGGSRTDFNQIDDGDFINRAVEITKNAATGNKLTMTINAIGEAINRRYVGINEANSKVLAKTLTGNKAGKQALQRIIDSQKDDVQKALMEQFVKDYSGIIGAGAVRANTEN